MVARKNTVKKARSSKRQSKGSGSIGNIVQRAEKLLNVKYSKNARQRGISDAVLEALKDASECDDISQLAKNAIERYEEAGENLSAMSEEEKQAAVDDVNNLLKKLVNDGRAVWISGFAKKKNKKNKEKTSE